MNAVNQEEAIQEKKRKVKEWLSKKENLFIVFLFLSIFLIRLYYFILTKNQPLWWDEAEYMSAAKGYAGIGDFKLAATRLPGLSLIASLFYILNITSEPTIRFFIIFIPSLIVLALVYLTISQMYPDKRIAIISLAIMALLWEHVFYSNRFQTENLSLIFEFLAIFILFKVYIKRESLWRITPKHSLIWIALLVGISLFFRPGNIMYVPAIILFLVILSNNFFLYTKKGKILLGGLILTTLAGFYIMITFSDNPLISYFYKPDQVITWSFLGIFKGFYLGGIFYYAIIFGFILLIADLILFSDKIKKIRLNKEDLELKSDIFNILTILFVISFFIFILKLSAGFEYRWFFSMALGMLAFTSKGLVTFTDYISKLLNSKIFGMSILIILVLFGLNTQWNHTNSLIIYKLDSFSQVKDSGLWIKSYTSSEDVILSASIMQHAFYAERKIVDFLTLSGQEKNETLFTQNFVNMNPLPKFMVVSKFEPGYTPEWLLTWPQKNTDKVIPVQVYYEDKAQTKPILIIYQVNQSLR
jgi:hypothetical protein